MSSLSIAGITIAPGERRRLDLPVSRLPTETWLSMHVEVIYGKKPGPRLWLSAAIHGDELNGVAIIRQVLEQLNPQTMRGVLLAVPIVNVFGFIQESRYLPDRRDLNRSFPGSPRGSLAARMAHLFLTEIAGPCEYGIDLHTGSHHRTNYPQIRADLRNAEIRRCAEAFGAPVLVHAQTRDGSLRHAATAQGKNVLLYEAGEALRFDQSAIRIGATGILRVMKRLRMISQAPRSRFPHPPLVEESHWIRARRGGILNLQIVPGQFVQKGDRLGTIADAFGENAVVLRANQSGIVLGLANKPLVHAGDAVVHLGRVAQTAASPGTAPEELPA